MKALLYSILCSILGCVTLGCQWIHGFEDFEACGGGPPPTAQGGPMSMITRPDGSCYWMDRFEVTRAEYNAFAGGLDEPSKLDPAPGTDCTWNTTFRDADCERAAATDDEQPAVCVDRCDALAFCAEMGKHLCHGDQRLAEDPVRDEFFAACSAAELSSETCNLATLGGATTPWPVNAQLECGADGGPFHLLGNVMEWMGGDESCAPAATDLAEPPCPATAGADPDAGTFSTACCMLRGGSFNTSIESAGCGRYHELNPTTRRPDVGFRCCLAP